MLNKFLPMTVAAVFYVIFCVTATTLAKDKMCPGDCRCNHERRTVYCHERKLTSMPTGIPINTKILLLHGNDIASSSSLEQELKRLIHLKKLDLHRNKLTSFPRKLPASIEYLSLQKNQINHIAEDVLTNLPQLKILHLDFNNISDDGLSPIVFRRAKSLEELDMTGNVLEFIPANLPKSLKLLRLGNNRIRSVSSVVASNLTVLFRLDLSFNKITSIASKALSNLVSLDSLNLASNFLQEIPAFLPSSLSELLLSKNSIRYVDADPISKLGRLSTLDLSSNKLESVEINAFSGLASLRDVELHNNPWHCDCYLVYLKKWLTETKSVISSEGNVKCRTPQVFRDVTIGSIDLETLTCDKSFGENILFTEISFHSIRIGYMPDDYEPSYLKYNILYGPLSCVNCSVSKEQTVESVTSILKSWKNFTLLDPFVNLTNLTANTWYAVCVYPTIVTMIKQSFCKEIQTSIKPASSQSTKSISWTWTATVSVCSAIGFLLVLCLIIWKVRSGQHATKPVTTTEQKSWLYASSTTLDARQEFNVALRSRPAMTSQYSINSDVVSTIQTRTTGTSSEISTLPSRPISCYDRYKLHNTIVDQQYMTRLDKYSTDLKDNGFYV